MSVCVYNYFLEKVEETEISSVIEHALKISKEHVKFVTKIFQQEEIPIPIGFKEEDVKLTHLDYIKIHFSCII
jgi:hypothetical protein